MRDGIHLSAWLFLPPGEGPWPALFEQRYAAISGPSTRQKAAQLAAYGYAVAMVSFRGAQQSEGRYVGYRALGWGEKKDGYDTCEWLAAQPWCTGRVGSFGSSQGGYAQNFLAVTQPPHLTCQYMVDTGLSLFHEGYRIGGVTRPSRFAEFGKNCRNPEDNIALLDEWDRHPDYDAYWQDEDCSLHFDEMRVPCFTIGSWYDFMVQGSIGSFRGRRSGALQQLLLGPWLHGRLNKGSRVGDLTYPENATWPELDHMTRWFDHWLKDADNGIENDPPVRYYVMGAVGEPGAPGNVWRQAQNWPPKSRTISYYLREDAGLSAQAPTAPASHTDLPCDPQQPMSIPGRSFLGARDGRDFEAQKDVRTWTTDPLTQPLEITGEIFAECWVQTSVPDTDLILRLSDVYPDGRSIVLMEYPFRARYREGFDHQALLTPDQPTPLKWHIGWTSIILNQGHRLRATLACTGAPLYDPNPQTGAPQRRDGMSQTQAATHAILHQAAHPSRLLLPVIDTAPQP
ncbi:MAG: CocE/NonD family hydrolase [Verrucomicrobiales bacterium]|nr:CocE/NonD family hydrolase [Verrucomicrobiales bacterium]